MRRAGLLSLVLAAQVLVAQDAPGMPFEAFQGWMKSTQVPGYSLMACEKDGAEYTAAFMGAGPDKLLMVRAGSLGSFNDVKKMPGAPIKQFREFTLQGFRAISYLFTNMPMIQVELKGKRTSLTLAGAEGMPMTEVDKLAAALKLGEKGK